MSVERKTCGTCAAFAAPADDRDRFGECRLRAPTPQYNQPAVFPWIMSDDWCLEHTPIVVWPNEHADRTAAALLGLPPL